MGKPPIDFLIVVEDLLLILINNENSVLMLSFSKQNKNFFSFLLSKRS